MQRVKFWNRIKRDHYDEWTLVEGWDASSVPTPAWKAFNKAFWQWKTSGLLRPLDELDAYTFAAGEMVKSADKVVGSRVPRDRIPETTQLSLNPGMRASGTLAPTVLTRATPTTYLVSAAYRSLMKYRDRQVQPVRDEYAAIAKVVRKRKDEGGVPDVTAFVEALPGVHSFAHFNAMRLAAVCVAETLEKLDADARVGLRAWLEADGVWVDAARTYNPDGSVQGYVYRFKHRWAPAFRKNCKWVW